MAENIFHIAREFDRSQRHSEERRRAGVEYRAAREDAAVCAALGVILALFFIVLVLG
jgi:hypothetical protein